MITKRSTSNRMEIAEEAADWFVRLCDGVPSRALRQAFTHWLLESPVHVHEYLATTKLCGKLEHIDPAHEIDLNALVPGSDSDANVVALDINVVGSSASTHSRRWLLGVAASVAAIAITLATTFWPDLETYTTGLGEQRSIVLEDGSIVELNTLTEIRIAYAPGERRVKLIEGEALFEVKKDAQRPFVVDAGLATVRVLGTRFNIYKSNAAIEVTVLSGHVTIERLGDLDDSTGDVALPHDSPAAKVELSVGEHARIVPRQPQIARAAVTNMEQVTAWTERRLIFDAVPLADMVAQFNRYNASRLEVEEGDLARLELSGVFGSNDPDSFIVFLQRLRDIEVVERPDGTRVIRTPRPEPTE